MGVCKPVRDDDNVFEDEVVGVGEVDRVGDDEIVGKDEEAEGETVIVSDGL